MNLRPVESTEQVPGQPKLHNETLESLSKTDRQTDRQTKLPIRGLSMGTESRLSVSRALMEGLLTGEGVLWGLNGGEPAVGGDCPQLSTANDMELLILGLEHSTSPWHLSQPL